MNNKALSAMSYSETLGGKSCIVVEPNEF